MRIGLYPGTFDPITNGHVAIIRSGLVVFDRLTVAVLKNPKKSELFSVDERIEMIRHDAHAFAGRVADLAGAVDPKLAESSCEDAAQGLIDRLAAAKRDLQRLTELVGQRSRYQTELEKAGQQFN